MNSWFCYRLLKSSICLTINPDNKSVKKRSQLVELSTCKKTWKEIEDEVESKSQPSEKVKRTKEFSGENSEFPQESIYFQKGNKHSPYQINNFLLKLQKLQGNNWYNCTRPLLLSSHKKLIYN